MQRKETKQRPGQSKARQKNCLDGCVFKVAFFRENHFSNAVMTYFDMPVVNYDQWFGPR